MAVVRVYQDDVNILKYFLNYLVQLRVFYKCFETKLLNSLITIKNIQRTSYELIKKLNIVLLEHKYFHPFIWKCIIITNRISETSFSNLKHIYIKDNLRIAITGNQLNTQSCWNELGIWHIKKLNFPCNKRCFVQ